VDVGRVKRGAAAAVGAVFGFTLAWSAMSEPDVIRAGLLFDDLYLYWLFGTAVATAAAGLWLLRRLRFRALLTGEPVSWHRLRPERRHVGGSVLFGTGWAISAACPGPVAAQIGSGVPWALATFAGIAIGIRLYLARRPAAEPVAAPAPVS
jgi:uncharacterized protein